MAERTGERGLSPDLAEKFPHLRIIHMCASIATNCQLKKHEPSRCDQITGGTFLSSSTEEGWEVTRIIPEHLAKGCDQCPLNKTS